MHIPWYIPFTKIFFMSISNCYAVRKITNIKTKEKIIDKILIILLCLVAGIIYSILRRQVNLLTAYLIYYSMFSIIYSIYSNKNIQKDLIVALLANTITIVNMILAIILNFFIMKLLGVNLNQYNIFEYIIIGFIQLLFTYLFFKINRFKNGFSFLKSENKIFTIIGVVICLILIVIFSLIGKSTNDILIDTYCTIGIIIGGILMFYWIKKSITKYYKEKMKERTVEIQQEQIKEKDETIKNLETELATVLQINHKYSQRISAMEKAVTKLGTILQLNEEYAEEYGDILSYINELSKEYKEEVALTIKENKLPKTNVFSIDNLLEYMKQEAEKEKIDFDLELEFNINEIIENKIAKNKLETILTDHIRDAIIAIKSSENKNRKIKVILNKDENYQIEFYDTGIEFEIDTLLKLGLERTTTHKATGGTGIGFVTTFETLKECKASLIIEEFNNKQYTKAIIIKFDNKNEYKIHSYRAEEIKNKTKNNRIKIYKIN